MLFVLNVDFWQMEQIKVHGSCDLKCKKAYETNNYSY